MVPPLYVHARDLVCCAAGRVLITLAEAVGFQMLHKCTVLFLSTA